MRGQFGYAIYLYIKSGGDPRHLFPIFGAVLAAPIMVAIVVGMLT